MISLSYLNIFFFSIDDSLWNVSSKAFFCRSRAVLESVSCFSRRGGRNQNCDFFDIGRFLGSLSFFVSGDVEEKEFRFELPSALDDFDGLLLTDVLPATSRVVDPSFLPLIAADISSSSPMATLSSFDTAAARAMAPITAWQKHKTEQNRREQNRTEHTSVERRNQPNQSGTEQNKAVNKIKEFGNQYAFERMQYTVYGRFVTNSLHVVRMLIAACGI